MKVKTQIKLLRNCDVSITNVVNQGRMMNIKKIIEVCQLRHRSNLGCRRCKYMGKTCKHASNILKVEKPCDYQS